MSDDRFDLQGAVNRGEIHPKSDEARRASAFKLVDAFSGITRKRLRLRDAATAYTDGSDIAAPLDAPDAYKQIEHRLAHILFRTDTLAKKVFIEEYVRLASDQAAKQNEILEDHHLNALGSLLSEILNVLECHRVESLWSLLYSGSYRWGRREARLAAAQKDSQAHEAIGTYLSILETGHEPPSGAFDRIKPYCIEALRKTELRGYNATLIVTKWLVTHLVSEMLDSAREAPPPPPALPLQDLGDKAGHEPSEGEAAPSSEVTEFSDEDGESVGNSGQMPGDVDPQKEGELKDGPGKDTDKESSKPSSGESDKEGKPDPDSPGSGKWSPNRTNASPQERAKALKKLLDNSGHKARSKPANNDTRAPKASSGSDVDAARRAVSEALNANISDVAKMDAALDASKRDMLSQVERARGEGTKTTEDEWLRKEVDAKIVLRKVTRNDVRKAPPLATEDVVTVQRLRTLFNRILGRRKTVLDDYGEVLDVGSYVARRALKQSDIPVFRREARGQGFKLLLLIDRSHSMQRSGKIEQAERACRILTRALRYPFVQLHVWGFQSLGVGQIDIVRFDPLLESFDSNKSAVRGETPLPLALSVAYRFMGEGSEVKHVVAVTDGVPTYHRADGTEISHRQLLLMSKNEVSRASARKISTMGAIIGGSAMWPPDTITWDLGPKELQFVFGRGRWKQLHPATFGEDLINLATTSFLSYLKST